MFERPPLIGPTGTNAAQGVAIMIPNHGPQDESLYASSFSVRKICESITGKSLIKLIWS